MNHLATYPLTHAVQPSPARAAMWLRACSAVGNSPPLVLIHELGGSLQSWDRCLPALEASGRRVLRYNWRGTGTLDYSTGSQTVDYEDGMRWGAELGWTPGDHWQVGIKLE